MPGLNIPRNALHIACSHLPRVMIVMWLSAAVAGLVIVSKQASCVTADLSNSFWQAGTGCQIHRSLVIISILTLYVNNPCFTPEENCFAKRLQFHCVYPLLLLSGLQAAIRRIFIVYGCNTATSSGWKHFFRLELGK
jgi:hypothetical protein